MGRNPAIETYAKRYGDIEFERRGLFALLRSSLGEQRVLYPASAMHVTPSFYFREVVYVDISPESARFFSDPQDVLELIDRNRVYRGRVSWQFLNSDFRNELPFRASSFDLLLSLYAGQLVDSVLHYLKRDGLILTRDAAQDAVALRRRGWEPELDIVARDGRYRIDRPGACRSGRKGAPRTGLRRDRGKLVFRDNDCYCLFRAPQAHPHALSR